MFTYRGPGASAFTESGLYAQLAERDAIGNMQAHHLSQEDAFGRVLGVVRGALFGAYGGQQCLRGGRGEKHSLGFLKKRFMMQMHSADNGIAGMRRKRKGRKFDGLGAKDDRVPI